MAACTKKSDEAVMLQTAEQKTGKGAHPLW